MGTETDDDEKARTEQYLSCKSTVVGFAFQPLVRSELGTLNFASITVRFEFLRGLLTRVDDDVVKLLASTTRDALNTHLVAIVNFLGEAGQFKLDPPAPAQSPPHQRRSVLIEAFARSYDSLLPILWLPTLHSILERAQLEPETATARWATDRAKEAEGQFARLKAEADKVLETLREQAARTGADQYAGTFAALAGKFRNASSGWVVAVLGAALALGGFGLWLLWAPHPIASAESPSTQVPFLITQVAGRLAILSALIYLLGWCARNYRASKHNEVVNRHREVALKTLELFRDAAGDENTKDAVLLRTTEAIFQHQGSGYQASDKEPSPASNTIIEILRRGTGEKE